MRRAKVVILAAIIAVFFAGTVAAQDWHSQDSGTTEPLFGVYFVNEQTGWAVGGPGIGFPTFPSAVILKTDDGGATWIEQDSPVDAQLLDVCFADALHGWAVGSSVIISTDDGGDTWIEQNTPFETTFWDISCFDDSNTAYAVGYPGNIRTLEGAILKTTNGGDTWVEMHSGVQTNLLGSYFTDENTGYAVGNGGVIVKTTDGTRFEQLDLITRSGIPVGLSDIYCLSANECWLAGAAETVYHTINGGERWDEFDTGNTVSGLGGVYFTDEENGWVTGQQTIRHTNDTGVSWINDITDISDRLGLIPVAFVRDVHFAGNAGWGVGDEGLILRYGEPVICADIPNPCREMWAPVYNETTGCISSYLCAVRDRPELTAAEPEEDCLDQYQECLDEYYPDYPMCDETYEFCEGIDEVLAEYEETYKYTLPLSYASQLSKNFLIGERINVHITKKDGIEKSFGATAAQGNIKITSLFENPTLSVYSSESTINDIRSAENPKAAAAAALKNKEIVVKGNKFQTAIKVFFFKIALSFYR